MRSSGVLDRKRLTCPSRPVNLPFKHIAGKHSVSILKREITGLVSSLDPFDDKLVTQRPKALEANHFDFVVQKTRRVVRTDKVSDEEATELVGNLGRNHHVLDMLGRAPNLPRDRLGLPPHLRRPSNRRVHIDARARYRHAANRGPPSTLPVRAAR